MLKASAGGGGKGIRKVNTKEELAPAFESASQEAKVSFGNGAMYIEKVIYPARHIEVQILGDSYGNIVHLGERDCSLQRNNQKVLEESPSVAIGKTLRDEIGLRLSVLLRLLIMKMRVLSSFFLMKNQVSFTLWK